MSRAGARRIQLTACEVDLEAEVAVGTGGRVSLSTTEARLLTYLSARPGVDVSRGELLREVWGYAEGAVTRTVDTTMTRLRSKLERTPKRPDHLVTVWGTGYRFVPPPDEGARSPSPMAVLPDELPRPSTNLVSRASGYLGSEALFATVAGALAVSRVVTLLGPAGVGKTRLAQELALASVGDYPSGAWFCDLSECHDLSDACAALAQVLDIALSDPHPVDQLGRALASRGRVLLVLDNFEQLAPLAADTVGRWSQLAPEARLLTTSRELLRVEGEAPVAVPPLDVRRGVRLFADRAASARPGFSLSEQEALQVEDLVRELDGLPLAIELAAARAGVLGVAGLRARLSQRFELLRHGHRGLPARHASLLGALESSWDLLEPSERQALAQLSVFSGAFDMDAAEGVVRADGASVDLVQALRDKSLLVADQVSVLGGPRVSMLLCVRDYAASKLDDGGLTELRHAEHLVARAERLRPLAEEQRVELLALAELRADLAAVCKRFTGHGEAGVLAARAALAQVPLWIARGPIEAAARVLGEVQADAAHLPDLDLEVRLVRAECVAALGQVAEAGRASRAALDDARAHGLPLREAQAYRMLGLVAALSGHFDEADALTQRARECFEAAGGPRDVAHISCELGLHRLKSRALDEALEPMLQGVSALRRLGHRRSLAARLPQLAAVHLARGERDACREAADEAMGIALELSERWLEGRALRVLADVCMEEGDLREAEALLDRAITRVRDYGSLLTEATVLGRRAHLHELLGDGARAEALWSELVVRCQEAGLDRQASAFGERLRALRERAGSGC